jgi:hypothetical protein
MWFIIAITLLLLAVSATTGIWAIILYGLMSKEVEEEVTTGAIELQELRERSRPDQGKNT